jgi:biotin carboxyl carrier protein
MATDLLIIETEELPLAGDSRWRRHKVVLAAAVAAAGGERAKARQIREAPEPALLAWAGPGRFSIHAFHQVVPRRPACCPKEQPMQLRIRVDDETYDVDVEILDEAASSHLHELEPEIEIPSSVFRRRPPQKLPEDSVCRSPIAGQITRVAATVGQSVRKDEPLLTIEAMKMENQVGPAMDGVIKAIHVSSGEVVKPGQVLLELA